MEGLQSVESPIIGVLKIAEKAVVLKAIEKGSNSSHESHSSR
jgi:hypothetical protein